MNEHLVQWVAPAPLWNDAAALGGVTATRAFRRPAILRFASDDFMDLFLAMLQENPARLAELRASPETWRKPAPHPAPPQPATGLDRILARQRSRGGTATATATATATTATGTATAAAATTMPLTLYQPAHQRYYLVAACLVCGIPGLPDRTLDPGAEEKVSFVLRKLRPKTGATDPNATDEYAFVTEGRRSGWRRAADPAPLAGEEQLPLFPVAYDQEDTRRRRLFAGLIPVGKRETYAGAPELPAAGASATATTGGTETPPDPRLLLFQRQVTAPWRSLLDQAAAVNKTLCKPGDPDETPDATKRRGAVREARNRLQTGSWYVLLDFAEFLQQQLPNVWSAISGQTVSLNGAEQALVTRLGGIALPTDLRDDLIADEPGFPSVYEAADVWSSLQSALAGIGQYTTGLEGVTSAYDRTVASDPTSSNPQWPSKLFPLADPLRSAPLDAGGVDQLEDLVAKAFPTTAAGPVPETPIGAQPPLDPRGDDRFVIRCVFERPHCAPLRAPLVSEPTEPFRLAGFFDPNAPARPIRIALPVDITPAGLRKFDKNTAFMVSDALRCQIDRMKGVSLGDLVRSVLPWPLHKDLPKGGACADVGLAISLSIPIITICALIMLIILVTLLDLIFRWLPYFIIVYPVTRLKAKGST
jgi:hypothetical protein